MPWAWTAPRCAARRGSTRAGWTSRMPVARCRRPPAYGSWRWPPAVIRRWVCAPRSTSRRPPSMPWVMHWSPAAACGKCSSASCVTTVWSATPWNSSYASVPTLTSSVSACRPAARHRRPRPWTPSPQSMCAAAVIAWTVTSSRWRCSCSDPRRRTRSRGTRCSARRCCSPRPRTCCAFPARPSSGAWTMATRSWPSTTKPCLNGPWSSCRRRPGAAGCAPAGRDPQAAGAAAYARPALQHQRDRLPARFRRYQQLQPGLQALDRPGAEPVPRRPGAAMSAYDLWLVGAGHLAPGVMRRHRLAAVL